MTMRARLAAPVEEVVGDINLFLRGWAGYFRYGNSAHTFDEIRSYALMRLALFVGKRHQRGRAWGFAQLYRSPNQLGLICAREKERARIYFHDPVGERKLSSSFTRRSGLSLP